MSYFRLVLLLTLFSVTCSGLIYFFNNYSIKLVVTHGLFCLSLFFISAAFSLAVRRPALKVLLFSLTSTFLLLLYASNASSNFFWKANININLLERMVTHYFHLQAFLTSVIVLIIPMVVFSLVFIFYRKLFTSSIKIEKKPLFAIVCYTSFSAIIFLKLADLNISRHEHQLSEYFVGEMFVDLISEYTDPHLDYVNNAGSIKDEVFQSLDYVPQVDENIDLNKKNIILLIVDCLRADHLHSYGYERNTTPFINRLMQEHNSQQVDNAFSMCDESKCGIRSILTSRSMEFQNSIEANNYSLHKKLSDDGYQVNFLLSSDHAFGGLKRTYFPNDFYIDGIGFKNYPLNDDRGLVSVLEQWPDYNGSPNYFHFHLFSAHEAGISYGKYLEKGVHGIEPGFLQGESIAAKFTTPSVSSGKTLQDTMDNGIYQTDLIFSRLYSQLEQKGYLDNALIVITGDHGQGLNEHGYFGHVKGLFNESLHVPLIMIDTSGDELTFTEKRYANQHDIAPTIAEMIGLSIEPTWEGKSLGQIKSEVTITTHRIPNRSASYAKTIFNPQDESLYKYIFMSTMNGLKEERFLFDLVNDPLEQLNLLEHSEQHKKWDSFVKKWRLDIL